MLDWLRAELVEVDSDVISLVTAVSDSS